MSAVTAAQAAAVGMLALVGCTSHPRASLVVADETAVFFHDEEDAMDALFSGTLRRDGRCLIIDDGVSQYTPFWPAGADLEITEQGLRVDGDREGRELVVGGGVVSDGYSELVDIARELCPGRDVWIIAE